MSAATLDSPTPALAAGHMTGPKTPQGKTVSSRNAVTHGLHAQDAVLPHLGEDQAEYDALCDGLARELSPRTAVERHYVQQIAQAMWCLRRLTRWEQHLYDDPALTDEERIGKMARVLRHDAALRRHIDRALRALGDTHTNCRNEPASTPAPPQPRRDFPSRKISPALQSRVTNCQNGPTPTPTPSQPSPWQGPSSAPVLEVARNEPEGVLLPPPIRASALRKAQKLKQHKKCQNETAIFSGSPLLGRGG